MKNTDFTEQWTAMQKMFLPATEQWTVMQKTSVPNFRNFGPASRKCATFLAKPGKGSGQLAGALANGWFKRRHTGTQRVREATERMCETADIRRSDPGVSGLGRRSVRADHGRRTYVSATNHGGNRRARIAAISAFANPKRGSSRKQRSELRAPTRSKLRVLVSEFRFRPDSAQCSNKEFLIR